MALLIPLMLIKALLIQVFFFKVPKEMRGERLVFYRNFNEAVFISTEYMGYFKEDYQLQRYDYPTNTISPKESILVVFSA